MLKFQAQTYRINDLLGWRDRRELVLAPDFQRRKVWSPRGKSYLIDSIVRGMPLPQFFIREKVLPKERRTIREVVDGQQRLNTIFDFIDGKVTMLPMHNDDYAKWKFEELPEDLQRDFLSFPLSVNVLQSADDPDVLEIFSRLNAYSVPLNQQEKLNAKYVGAFKKAVNQLAKSHMEFWKRNRILGAQAIARMKDVEITSELVGAMLLGLQNQKKIISDLFKEYDDDFPQNTYLAPRFGVVLQFCEDLFDGEISDTAFKNRSLFYSLYCAAYDRMFGLTSDEDGTENEVNEDGIVEAKEAVLKLSEALSEDGSPEGFEEFKQSTLQSTDKLPNRKIRHAVLLELLSPAFE